MSPGPVPPENQQTRQRLSVFQSCFLPLETCDLPWCRYLKDSSTKRSRYDGGGYGSGYGGGYGGGNTHNGGYGGNHNFGSVTNNKDNPPCNTLFIGNLGDVVSSVPDNTAHQSKR